MTMQGSRKPFVVMAKPVGSRCNMRCAYCYYLEKGKFSAHAKQSRMSFGLLEKLIRQTIEASDGTVSFTWHGGEPTLAGLDFYQKVVELEKKYLPRGWEVWNNIQTNGLLLNDAWCKFLRENRFDVGLSIDGAQWVHDKNRRDIGGNETYERTVRAVRRLQAAGIQPDLLCTVTSDAASDPLGVYRGLRKLGTGWVQFIPIIVREEGGAPSSDSGELSPESVTPEGYGTFLCAVFDEWLTHDLGSLDVQLFAEVARIWAGGEANLCWMAPTCGRVLIAEEDGAVYACDHFVDGEHRLGTLSGGRLDTLANSERQFVFGDAKRDALTAECKRCPYLSCCNGGCLKDRFGMSEDGEPGQYLLCKGLKQFFAHADKPLHRVMELSSQGMKPAQIMEQLRVEQERP